MSPRQRHAPLLAGLLLALPLVAVAHAKAKKHADGAPSTGGGLGGTFDVDRLPKGANVTIPRPATTLVKPGGRVVLTATDIPQTLSFKPVSVQGAAVAAAGTLHVSIYDPHAERVQHVELKPGTPFLYNFKELFDSITVLPEGGGGAALEVESDKPLQIAH